MAKAKDPAQHKEYGLKLLVYVRCCLWGNKYPPASGVLAAEQAETVKLKILCFLLYTKAEELNNLGNSMGTLVKTKKAEDNDSEYTPDQVLFADPHPVLQCLLSVNAPAAVWMFQEVLKEWDCVEKDLMEAWTGQKCEEMTTVRSVTQVKFAFLLLMLPLSPLISCPSLEDKCPVLVEAVPECDYPHSPCMQVVVDSLVTLMEVGVSWNLGAALEDNRNQNVIVEFICKCVGSGRAIVPGAVVLTLLQHLAVRAEQQPGSKEAMEELFVDIVRSVIALLSGLVCELSRSFAHHKGCKLTLL